jgi:hypothetical protein
MSIIKTHDATRESPAEYEIGNPTRCLYCHCEFDLDDEGEKFYDPHWLDNRVVCRETDCWRRFQNEYPQDATEIREEYGLDDVG